MCYTYPMKRIYISDIVHDQLKREAKAEGRTLQWVVENRLTGTTPLPKNTEPPKPTGISGSQYTSYEKPILTPNVTVDDLIKQAPEYDEKVAERQLSGELTCCTNDVRPCKHWVWDTTTGEGYRNTLSGRYREAE